MNKQSKAQDQDHVYEEFLQQDTSEVMKELGFKPTIDLSKRSQQDKIFNIVGKVNLSNNNVPVDNQPKDLAYIPVDILRELRDVHGTRTMLLKMGYSLPNKSSCPLSYMMQILSGQKIGLKLIPDDTCAQFKPHLESLHLLEARISDWLDYLVHFKKWEYFIPNVHVANIKYEASLDKE